MRLLLALVIFATLNASPAVAADALAEARRFYNLGDYDAAAEYAREAIKVPGTAASGRLVLGAVVTVLHVDAPAPRSCRARRSRCSGVSG
jgi:hypothetical protein